MGLCGNKERRTERINDMKRLSINCRTFVKGLSAVAAMGVLGTGEMVGADLAIADDASFPAPLRGKPIEAKIDPETGKVEVNKDVLVRYSMLQRLR